MEERRLLRVLPWLLLALSAGLAGVGVWLRIPTTGAWLVEDVPSFVATAGFCAVGAVVAARRPGNPYGWLCLAFGLMTCVLSVTEILAQPGRASSWPLLLGNRLAYPVGSTAVVFLLLLFPTGHLAGPRWRWVARATLLLCGLAAVTGMLGSSADGISVPAPWSLTGRTAVVLDVLHGVGVAALLPLTLVGALSVLARYRRAGSVERQQVKWFVFAVVLTLVQVAVRPFVPDAVGVALASMTFAALPIALGIAVLRYRLFEIDRILSRTVSYALLTGGLVLLYVVVVAGLRTLLAPVTGTTELAVAASTLAVAAASQPARRHVQAVVDRRFDRARYDAARTVDAYARRLRTEVDLDEVTAGLRDTVTATVGPQRVGLWLRDAGGPT